MQLKLSLRLPFQEEPLSCDYAIPQSNILDGTNEIVVRPTISVKKEDDRVTASAHLNVTYFLDTKPEE